MAEMAKHGTHNHTRAHRIKSFIHSIYMNIEHANEAKHFSYVSYKQINCGRCKFWLHSFSLLPFSDTFAVFIALARRTIHLAKRICVVYFVLCYARFPFLYRFVDLYPTVFHSDSILAACNIHPHTAYTLHKHTHAHIYALWKRRFVWIVAMPKSYFRYFLRSCFRLFWPWPATIQISHA